MVEIGINSNNNCGQDVKEILTNIKNAGFENVMLALKIGKAEDSLRLAAELGLKVPFVHLSYSDNLWCKGKENEWYMATLKEQIELAGKYNIPIAVLHATGGRAERLALPPNQHGLNCVLELLKLAKKHKVKLALENLDKSSFKHFTFIMDNIRDKNLGFCYDAGHHQLYNPHVDLLKKYGNRIMAIHWHSNFMDWEYGYDWSRDLHLLPFDGKVDYNKIIGKLAKTPYNNVIMLEVKKDTYGQYDYDKLSNMEYLKRAYQQGQKLAAMFEHEKMANFKKI